MSRYNAQTLYAQLPAVYRQRDIEHGEPLKDLFESSASRRQFSRMRFSTSTRTGSSRRATSGWSLISATCLVFVRRLQNGSARGQRSPILSVTGAVKGPSRLLSSWYRRNRLACPRSRIFHAAVHDSESESPEDGESWNAGSSGRSSTVWPRGPF